MSDSPQYLTIKQFSQLSGLSISTLRRRVGDGTVPVIQPGGRRTRMLFASSVLDGLSVRRGNLIDETQNETSAESENPKSNKSLSGPTPRWRNA